MLSHDRTTASPNSSSLSTMGKMNLNTVVNKVVNAKKNFTYLNS